MDRALFAFSTRRLPSAFQTLEGSKSLSQVFSSLKEGKRKQTQETEKGSSATRRSLPRFPPRARKLPFLSPPCGRGLNCSVQSGGWTALSTFVCCVGWEVGSAPQGLCSLSLSPVFSVLVIRCLQLQSFGSTARLEPRPPGPLKPQWREASGGRDTVRTLPAARRPHAAPRGP